MEYSLIVLVFLFDNSNIWVLAWFQRYLCIVQRSYYLFEPWRFCLSLPSPSAFSFVRVTASCLGCFLSIPLTSRLLKLPTLVSVAATLEALSGGSSAQLSAISVLQMETCVWKRILGWVWICALTGSSWHCICQASLPMVIRSSFKLWLVSCSLHPLIRYLFSFHSTKSEIVRRYLGDRDREAWCSAVHGVTKSWTWQPLNKCESGHVSPEIRAGFVNVLELSQLGFFASSALWWIKNTNSAIAYSAYFGGYAKGKSSLWC